MNPTNQQDIQHQHSLICNHPGYIHYHDVSMNDGSYKSILYIGFIYNEKLDCYKLGIVLNDQLELSRSDNVESVCKFSPQPTKSCFVDRLYCESFDKEKVVYTIKNNGNDHYGALIYDDDGNFVCHHRCVNSNSCYGHKRYNKISKVNEYLNNILVSKSEKVYDNSYLTNAKYGYAFISDSLPEEEGDITIEEGEEEKEKDIDQIKNKLLPTTSMLFTRDLESASSEIEGGKGKESFKILIKAMRITNLGLIQRILSDFHGVDNEKTFIYIFSKTVSVKFDKYDCKPIELIKRLNNSYLEASLIEDKDSFSILHDKKVKKLYPPWFAILGLLTWLLSLISLIKDLPDFKWLGVVTCVLCLPSILRDCAVGIPHGVFDFGCIPIISCIGMLSFQDYISAGSIVMFYHFMVWFERLMLIKFEQIVDEISFIKPDHAYLVSKNSCCIDNKEKINVRNLNEGDYCIVTKTEKIPADGIVINKNCIVNEKCMSGSNSSIAKLIGDNVFAGTIYIGDEDNNNNEPLILKVTKSGENSFISQFIKTIQQTSLDDFGVEHYPESIISRFCYLIFILAWLTATIPFFHGIQFGLKYLKIGFIILALASPLSLTLSIPFIYLCSQIIAFKNGVVIKKFTTFDKLGNMKIIATNKTGTITDGNFGIPDIRLVIESPNQLDFRLIHPIDNQQGSQIVDILKKQNGIENIKIFLKERLISAIVDPIKIKKEEINDILSFNNFPAIIETQLSFRNEVLQILNVCEKFSSHMMARSFENGSISKFTVSNLIELPGEGIQCKLSDGRDVFIGNIKIFQHHPQLKKEIRFANPVTFPDNGDLTLPESMSWCDYQELNKGATTGWIIVNSRIRAVYSLCDNIRPESEYFLKKLKRMNIESIILSGDNIKSVQCISEKIKSNTENQYNSELILSSVQASLTSMEKSKQITDTLVGNDKNDFQYLSPDILSIGLNFIKSPTLLNTNAAIIDSNICRISWIIQLAQELIYSIKFDAYIFISVKIILIVLAMADLIGLSIVYFIDIMLAIILTFKSFHVMKLKSSTFVTPSLSEQNIEGHFDGWRQHNATVSLIESNASVHVPSASNSGFGRNLLSYFGVGLVVSVGYMDPGNWATDIAGGAAYGYSLMFIILVSSLAAMLLQYLSLKLGIATNRDLAMACRDAFPQKFTFVLWIIAEAAIAATDLAELLGVAIALYLLFGLSMPIGVGIAALDVFIILLVQNDRIRILEVIVGVLILVIVVCLAYLIVLAKPEWNAVFFGLLPSTQIVTDQDELFVAIGIIGATVMPHNLFLHSGLVQTRNYPRTLSGKKTAVKFATTDSTFSLIIAFFVNSMILILAGATFHQSYSEVNDITTAYTLFTPVLGEKAASIFFGVALLASGQQASLTGTFAGQIVMEGMINARLSPWKRRMLTRIVAMVPAVIITSIYDTGAGDLLILSQVILSLALPFVIIPLVYFTSDERKMGKEFVNSWPTFIVAVFITVILVGLNVFLISNPDTWKIGGRRRL